MSTRTIRGTISSSFHQARSCSPASFIRAARNAAHARARSGAHPPWAARTSCEPL
ncbi:hypothetical protein [Streptomyces sp. NPDC056190]|uniref:hypothetical protein n=1 Tax=Streptomyces sp. NPDC056190 TaxID=3345741 RepID=UPI0035E2EE1C